MNILAKNLTYERMMHMNNLGNYIPYKVRTSRIALKNPVEVDSNQYSLVNKITLTTMKEI